MMRIAALAVVGVAAEDLSHCDFCPAGKTYTPDVTTAMGVTCGVTWGMCSADVATCIAMGGEQAAGIPADCSGLAMVMDLGNSCCDGTAPAADDAADAVDDAVSDVVAEVTQDAMLDVMRAMAGTHPAPSYTACDICPHDFIADHTIAMPVAEGQVVSMTCGDLLELTMSGAMEAPPLTEAQTNSAAFGCCKTSGSCGSSDDDFAASSALSFGVFALVAALVR